VLAIGAASLSGPLPKLGVIVVALLAAAVLIARAERTRAWAMLGALVLAPVLLLAAIWHSPQVSLIHRHPLVAVVGAAIGLAVIGALAVVVGRRRWLLGPLAMLALPFRIPISAENTTSNLLVPLYLVVAAGALAWIVPVLRADTGSRARARGTRTDAWDPAWSPVALRALAGFVVLYGIQAAYSPDFTKALQQMVFFYVPFALLLVLLRGLAWDAALLARCLKVTAGLALAFAAIGFGEYATKTLLLNPKLVAANNVHTYFTVNSVFFDPDIFGRYLALVLILLVAVLLWSRRPRLQIGVTITMAVLWSALVLTLSRSSLGALLAGVAILAALRWRIGPVLALGAAVLVAGGIAVAVTPRTFGLNQGLNGASAGRANLVSGGVRMFAQRPLQGYGSAAFVKQYTRENPAIATNLAASHTIPVTVAAEQGVVGLIAYAALVISTVLTLLRGARGDPPRMAVAAAFIALVLHTMLYADFLEDPTTWALLGIGIGLAGLARARVEGVARESRRTRIIAA
jgi:putative inorganic carbon (HCO3(-)) transporter